MKNWIVRLWQGEVPLGTAFWELGIGYGTLIHLMFTGMAFGVHALGWPLWLAVVLFFLPAPYAILIVVAVWRSAERYQGPAQWAKMARIAIVIWAVVVTVV